MGSINQRNGKLVADFRYMNQRCREQTQLSDTSANRKRLTRLLKTILITHITQPLLDKK